MKSADRHTADDQPEERQIGREMALWSQGMSSVCGRKTLPDAGQLPEKR